MLGRQSSELNKIHKPVFEQNASSWKHSTTSTILLLKAVDKKKRSDAVSAKFDCLFNYSDFTCLENDTYDYFTKILIFSVILTRVLELHITKLFVYAKLSLVSRELRNMAFLARKSAISITAMWVETCSSIVILMYTLKLHTTSLFVFPKSLLIGRKPQKNSKHTPFFFISIR